MNTHTNWIDKTSFIESTLMTIKKLEEKYENIDYSLIENSKYAKETYHFATQILNSSRREEKVLLKHILNLAYKAELLSQGSSYWVIQLIFGLLKYIKEYRLFNNRSFWIECARQQNFVLNKIKDIINECCIPGFEEYLLEGIKEINKDTPILNNVALKALQLAGLEGKIFVENGQSSKFLIECKHGYSFTVKPYNYFLMENKRWTADNCKVMIVDGLVENVSEIDNLLQKCYDTKQPMIIVAFGFSEEVVATLKANQERGYFDCIPVRIMPEIENLNKINDISIVCGTLPVSSLVGDLICFVKYENLPTVERVELTQNEMIIHNSKTIASVNAQIKNILEKKNNLNLFEDMQNILDKRLRSLVSNSVVVHLPETTNLMLANYRTQLDNCFRYAKSIINYGVIQINDFLSKINEINWVESELGNCCSYAINHALKNKNWLPTLSVYGSIQLTVSFFVVYFSSGGMIIVDQDS